jgi:outer membrane protein insertion porin family
MIIQRKSFILFFILCIFTSHNGNFSPMGIKNTKSALLNRSPLYENIPSIFIKKPIIENIFIEGLETINVQVILAKLPFFVGDILERKKAASIVKNIFSLGYFSDVSLYYSFVKDTEEKKINLHIKVKEKKRVASIKIIGNEHISEETLEKKLHISKVNWIDDISTMVIIEKIKKLYAEKQYYKAEISHDIKPNETSNAVDVIITINEGVFGKIRTINFKGNNAISRFKLKENIVSREAWLLGFLDRGGVYRKEMVDYDRFQIEHFYHNNGFYEAQVMNVALQENEKNGMIDITFFIEEGPRYQFNNITFENHSILSEEKIKRLIRIKPGDTYSKNKIQLIIDMIKSELGEYGYIQAIVNPRMKVNKKNNTIDIEFIIEQGKPVYTRFINISGNNKTYEDVIRREILFNEGDILTVKKLEKSKRAIEGLGFFMQGTGVNTKLSFQDKYQVDVDILLQEGKTGRFYVNLAINNGSDAGQNLQMLNQEQQDRWYNTLLTASKIGLTLQDSNWNGKAIRYFLDASYASVDRSFTCGMSTPWIFNLPISAGWNATFRNLIYNDFKQATTAPNEKNQGVNFQFGYRCGPLDNIIFGLSLGMDNIGYASPVKPKMQYPDNPELQIAYSKIVLRSFQPGTITWFNAAISDDKRNHPVRATMGHKWIIEAKVALPNQSLFKDISNFGYARLGVEGSWYTPLITEYDVVLFLHGYAGYIYRFPECNIPYKELFHIGGPQNVRGFVYGQIGPMLLGSSLGATKSFFVNAEIRCPITKVNGMMALVFYDGGAGWDTIYQDRTKETPQENMESILSYFEYNPDKILIKNNSFQYRHSVGIGVRLSQPMPIKIDWGFKLDRNKKLGETLSEVHIAMEGEY